MKFTNERAIDSRNNFSKWEVSPALKAKGPLAATAVAMLAAATIAKAVEAACSARTHSRATTVVKKKRKNRGLWLMSSPTNAVRTG
jgi:uncharacterized protein YjaG (DUF416 family)